MEEKGVEEFENLPLRYAYPFLKEKGLENEAEDIRRSKDKYNDTRRSRILNLLENHQLLQEFVDKHWPFAKSDEGKEKLRRYKRIYDRWQTGEGPDEEESVEETSFVYEDDLRDYLSKNLSLIESGLQLYIDERGAEGVEYPVDGEGRRVDILAKDKKGIPVIVELKVSRGYEKVVGQCLYYRTRVKQLLRSQEVRIVIVAREISPQLRAATQDLPDIELFEYKLSIKLDKITSR